MEMAVAAKNQFKFPAIDFLDILVDPPHTSVIENLIPHRGQALLVDGIAQIAKDYRSIVSFYTVPEKTWWTEVHFPGQPIMPGVLLIEAAAQTGALLVACAGAVGQPLLVKVDKIRFFNPVHPLDSLFIYVELVGDDAKKRIWSFQFYIQNQKSENIVSGSITGVVARSNSDGQSNLHIGCDNPDV